MSQCLVVPKKVLESASFWPKLSKTKTKRVISAAVHLSLSKIQELFAIIKNNSVFMERKGPDGVEEKPEWQQIISYALIVQRDKFFLYQRGKTKTAYKEERLWANVSVGVGGHMDPSEAGNFINSMRKELREELSFSKNKMEFPVSDSFPKIQIIGVVKDNRDEVGKFHLGVVCLIELSDREIEVVTKSCENEWGKMVTLDEYRQIISSPEYVPEGWTELVVEHIVVPLLKDR